MRYVAREAGGAGCRRKELRPPSGDGTGPPPPATRSFPVEVASFFSQRQNQRVQTDMQRFGAMPSGLGADEMDDLF